MGGVELDLASMVITKYRDRRRYPEKSALFS